jgi:hypothetical protein
MRVVWQGAPITGPATSTFYWTNGVAGSTTALRSFFNSISSVLPTTVTVSVLATGDVLNDANGALAGVWTDTAVSSVTGTDGTGPIDGVGARIRWITGGIFGGRRVIGSTFIVPIGRGAMTSNGQPDGTTQSTLQTAASALVAASAGNLLIWSRPHVDTADGESNPVVGAIATGEVSWLRSRRT